MASFLAAVCSRVNFSRMKGSLGMAITGDTDPIGEEEYATEWDLVGEFATTVPTTLAGLLAMLIYADKMLEKENDAFGEYHPELIESLATAARAIGGGQ
jgi:hypothetical protein